MRKNSTGVALATAAAMLFGTALTSTASAADETKAEGAKIHCTGVNSCKGKGFLEMTKADCDAAKAKAK